MTGSPPPGARRLELRKMSTITPKRVRWLWDGRVPANELTMLAGPEGVGKSTLLAHLAAEATHGRLPGDLIGQPVGVVIAAMEDDEASTLRPRLEAAGANLELVASIRVRVGNDDLDGTLGLPDDMALLRQQVVPGPFGRHPVGLLILDPIKSAATSANTDRDNEVRALLGPLVKLAQAQGVTVIASGHFKKSSGSEDRATWKVSGSPAWTQVPRSTLFFAEDMEHEEDEGARIIGHAKCNVGRLQPSIEAKVVTEYVPGPLDRIETSRLIIGRESEVKVEDIGARGGDHSAVGEATDWLRQYLSDGDQHESRKINDAAKREGISSSSLARARKKLGVKPKRYGSGEDAGSLWQLPTPDMSDMGETSQQASGALMSPISPVSTEGMQQATPEEEAAAERALHLIAGGGQA